MYRNHSGNISTKYIKNFQFQQPEVHMPFRQLNNCMLIIHAECRNLVGLLNNLTWLKIKNCENISKIFTILSILQKYYTHIQKVILTYFSSPTSTKCIHILHFNELSICILLFRSHLGMKSVCLILRLQPFRWQYSLLGIRGPKIRLH